MLAHVWELLIHTLGITRQVGYLRRSKMTFCIGSIFLVTKGRTPVNVSHYSSYFSCCTYYST
jgi:hypothetical protein